MAHTKVSLYLAPSRTEKKVYNQPWYKERLRTKYIKSLKPTDTSEIVRGKNWTFIKDGLDDFRDGYPPKVDGGMVIQCPKGLSPNLPGTMDIASVKQPAESGRFNKYQICYSRVTPLQQQQREHLAEIEYGLMQHPLALYPHLENGMPPDVFEDVVDILDPEMNIAFEEFSDGDYVEDEEEEEEVGRSVSDMSTGQNQENQQDIVEEEKQARNPYRWIPRKDDKELERQNGKKKAERRPNTPSQDEHIKKVTQEFCEWVSSLGGESNNIEESTITSLFASGYETKPALSVPIHVVELTNVPIELRNTANVPPPQEVVGRYLTPSQTLAKRKEWKYSGAYEPSWTKCKYGAWYLNPNSWKKRNSEEPLQDPQEIKNQEMSDAKKHSTALDGELAPMHGARAFMEFIDKKATRRPEFLDRVAEIQENTEREERERLAAEMAKLKKANERKAATMAGK